MIRVSVLNNSSDLWFVFLLTLAGRRDVKSFLQDTVLAFTNCFGNLVNVIY